MTLWDGSDGFGAPVFVAEIPPWHPLTLLVERIAPDRAALLIPLAAAFLSGLALASVLRSLGSGRAHRLAAAALLGGGVAVLSSDTALLVLGIVFGLGSFEWLAGSPSRGRWALAVAAVVLALLGASSGNLLWLLILAAWPLSAVLRRFPARDRAAAGSVLAIATGLLLTAFWWWPLATLARPLRDAPRHAAGAHEPEYLTVTKHIVIRDPDRAAASARNLVDPAAMAMVDHIPAKILRMAGGRVELAERPRRATLGSYEEGLASVGIEEGGWTLLVTNEPWWPGWRVYWNGERLPPVTVNAGYVGTFVPPGSGTLHFRYRPDAFDDGLRAGAAGLVLLLATLAWPWFLKIPERDVRPRAHWFLSGALSRAARQARSAAGAIGSLSRFSRPAALSLFAAYALFLTAYGVAVAGGSDSSGYMNHARLLLEGNRVVPLNLAHELRVPPSDFDRFLPLGFAPGVTPGTIVPSYPPGVPFHLALIEVLFGGGALRAFGPVAGLASLVLMYALAREIGFSRSWAWWSAAVLALCATFIMFSVTIMSDVVATAWSLAAMLGALRVRRNGWWGVLAGCAFGLSALVRPTQVLLLPALAVAIGANARSLLAFAFGGAPFAAVQAATGAALWGGALRSGYGEVLSTLSFDYFATRFSHYSRWLAALLSPLVFPLGLAGTAVASVDRRLRIVLALWFAPFFVFYTLYFPYETWWYTRFLLPAAPALILLAFLAARAAAAKIDPERRTIFLGALLAIVLASELWHDGDKRPWKTGRREDIYPRAIAMASDRMGERPIVLGMQHSGAFAYYRKETMVRWDMLRSDDFERLRAHASIAGRTWYALLADFEAADAFRRAPGNWVPIGRVRDVTLYELRP